MARRRRRTGRIRRRNGDPDRHRLSRIVPEPVYDAMEPEDISGIVEVALVNHAEVTTLIRDVAGRL